jgi:uncharacterized cupredoxin-like copper-binding protein
MRPTIWLPSIAAAAVLSGCGKETPKGDSAAVAQSGAAVTPAAQAAAYDPTSRTATVIAKDFAFEAPDSIPAGWTTIRLVNDGMNLHHAVLVRLEGGKTLADAEAAMKNPGPPPSWIVPVGGPNAPNPKSEANATVELQPGNYVMLCFVDIPEKTPHFMKGMVRPLKVTASTGPSSAPVADVVVSLADYAFTVKSGTLSSGKHVIQVVNDGPQEHELELIRLAPGKTVKDMGAWVAKPEGPPPADALGGIVGVAKGSTGFFNVELSPGNYVLLCFVPDAKDGKAHLEHGMIKEFTVQ